MKKFKSLEKEKMIEEQLNAITGTIGLIAEIGAYSSTVQIIIGGV